MRTKEDKKMKRINITDIKNRSIIFLEDMPEPSVFLYGTPIYHIKTKIEGNEYSLELYHKRVLSQLLSCESLCGHSAMIQLPEQQGAEWMARVW